MRSLRKQKLRVFLDLDDGSTWERVGVVVEGRWVPPGLSLGSSLDVTGRLEPSPRNPARLELHPTAPIALIGPCDQTRYPLPGTNTYHPDTIRLYPHLRFKNTQ